MGDSTSPVWLNNDEQTKLWRIQLDPFDGGSKKTFLVLDNHGHSHAMQLAESAGRGKVVSVDLVITPLIVGDIGDVERMLKAG